MARVILLGSRRPRGSEKNLCDYMQDALDDESVIIYPQYPFEDANFLRTIGKRGEAAADFVITEYNLGVWLLEQKAWKPETIHNFNGTKVFLNTATGVAPTDSPYFQIEQYARGLMRDFNSCKTALCDPVGRRGDTVRFYRGVIFNNIERDEFEKARFGISPSKMHMTLFGSEAMPFDRNQFHKNLLRLPFTEVVIGGTVPNYPPDPKPKPVFIPHTINTTPPPPPPPPPKVQPKAQPHSGAGCMTVLALAAAAFGGIYLFSEKRNGPGNDQPDAGVTRLQNPIHKTVKSPGLNVREHPTEKSASKAKLTMGDDVLVIGTTEGPWREIEAEVSPPNHPAQRIHGYVNGNYLKLLPQQPQ